MSSTQGKLGIFPPAPLDRRRERAPFAAVQLVLALAAALAVAAAGSAEAPSAAAETGYLALLIGCVLGAVAVVDRRPAWALTGGALFSTALAWTLPTGATRATAVVAVLVASLLAAAAGRLRPAPDELPWEVAAPVACGLQLLLRSDLLLAATASPQRLGLLLGLPLAGAAALVVLARRRGRFGALVTGALLLAAGPGWTLEGTVSLVALAAADSLPRRSLPRLGRWAAALLLIGLLAWRPRAAGLAIAAAAALGGGGLGPAGAVAATAGGVFLALAAPLRGWSEAGALAAWLPWLVPALLAVPARWLVPAAALALGAARAAPVEVSVTAPLALLALALPRSSPAAGAQGSWSGFLLAGSAVLAAYPWLRATPVADLLSSLGLEPTPPPAWAGLLLVALVAVAARAAAALAWPRPPRVAVRALALLGALVVVAAGLAALPAAGLAVIAWPPLRQDVEHPSWRAALGGDHVRTVVLESRLARAAALPPGTPAAIVRLRDGQGREQEWVVASGVATGEWAARRGDLAGRVAAPAPWRAWTEPEGFFGQSYRARWMLTAPFPAREIGIERPPELDPQVVFLVERLELRR